MRAKKNVRKDCFDPHQYKLFLPWRNVRSMSHAKSLSTSDLGAFSRPSSKEGYFQGKTTRISQSLAIIFEDDLATPQPPEGFPKPQKSGHTPTPWVRALRVGFTEWSIWEKVTIISRCSQWRVKEADRQTDTHTHIHTHKISFGKMVQG